MATCRWPTRSHFAVSAHGSSAPTATPVYGATSSHETLGTAYQVMTPVPLLTMLTISTDEPVVGSKPILALGSGITICGAPRIFERCAASGAAVWSVWNGCEVGMSILE